MHHGCCNAVAVGRKPRRKETSRIASCERGLLCAEVYPRMHRHGGTSSAPPSLLRPQKLHPCHRARELLSSVVEESKGSWRPREVTKVGAEWIADIEADRNFLIDFSYPASRPANSIGDASSVINARTSKVRPPRYELLEKNGIHTGSETSQSK